MDYFGRSELRHDQIEVAKDTKRKPNPRPDQAHPLPSMEL